MKKLRVPGGQTPWPAVHGDSLPGAIGVLAGLGEFLQGRTEIVRDEKIQVPVAVVIDPTASGAVTDNTLRETCAFGYVGKSSVPVVVIEHVVPVVGDEQVVETVIVVIADSNGGRPTGTVQSGFRGDIGKTAIPVVLVKTVGGSRRIALQPRAAEHEQIHPAIVVVVDKRDAGA